MRLSAFRLVISFAILTVVLCVAPARAQQGKTERFELRGVVISAATGEPVSWALVEIAGPEGRKQLAGSDGSFAFANLPPGRYSASASKPGFFNNGQLGRSSKGRNSSQDVPSSAGLVLKLTPEGVIYGEVKNENSEPMEGIEVSAKPWQVEDGRRRLQSAGDATTDDEGKYRIAELTPGRYRLAYRPGSRAETILVSELRRKKAEDQGYAPAFYPGVSDADSATAIEVRAGAQVHIAQALKRQRLFEVAGVVRGAGSANSVAFRLLDTGGDAIQRSVRIEPRSGQFQIPAVPAGTYLLSAFTGDPNEEGRLLTATQLIHVNADVSGVAITFEQGASLRIQVRDEIPPDGTNQVHPVSVVLHSKEFPQYSAQSRPPAAEGEGPATARIEGVAPGTYTVMAFPQSGGYIAALRCGNVDLLKDDLTVAVNAALPPIEVTLRNDGAELTVMVVEDGQPAAGGVVIYSEEYPRRAFWAQTNDTGTLSMGNLAPGNYQLVAVEDAQDLEFRNPSAMEKYLSHATEVTLLPGDKASLQVELQKPREQEQ